MPSILPEEMKNRELIQKRFHNYNRRGIQKQIKPSSKPTLDKKLSQWNKAQLQMKKTELEILYWQTNQDPKIYALLDASQKEDPED